MGKPRMLLLRLPLPSGVCRWCQCTYSTPCVNGCGWVDQAETLCTACVPLERALQSPRGRRALALFLQELHWP